MGRRKPPSSNRGVLPLSNFNTTNFTNASATINGVQSSIDGYNAANPSSPLWQYTPINMITSRGVVQASTGILADNTTTTPATSGFTVTFIAPAAPAPAPRPTPPPPPSWWWWFSTNEASRIDPMAMTGSNNNANPALTVFTPTAGGPQTSASVSAAPPENVPLAPSAAPWLSLVGPAQNVGDDDMEPEMLVPGNLIASGRDLFHPSAVALASVSDGAIETGRPQIAVDAFRGANAVLVDESPAVANAPPASQPEPRGNFVIKSMSKAFWLVAGLAFVSHRSFARGKRRTELYPNENERTV